VRGLVVRGGTTNGVYLDHDVHDVVIENNDISGWGHACNPVGFCGELDAGVRAADGGTFSRITVQRNNIHDPRGNANDYCEPSESSLTDHPIGPRAVALPDDATNNVIRYNDVHGSLDHSFNDGMGENDNSSTNGFPNADTDIYGNYITDVVDDGLEMEGADMNVRVWENYINRSFTGVSSAVDSVGPLYIFRNVYGHSQKCAREDGGYNTQGERGVFGKLGDFGGLGGGRRYYFHNTLLQIGGETGASFGPANYGGPMTNTVSRDNVWHTVGSPSCYAGGRDASNDLDYDLCTNEAVGPHSVEGVPIYAPGNGDSADVNGPSGMYQLAENSPGFHAGQVLPNFADDFGAQPDMGAQPSGGAKMEFGVKAYL